ncbi:MAG: NUDIX hydrolase [Tepidanaerobacter acetatoxydans]|uniref:NUDIX hydrolase n=1 Tax=Tepidanaerobacter TaxID=499228 RepID=UPI000AF7E009|nr:MULTISPECIES: NUDIX hydrolase [Tepidanaerobacter]NLU09825.1 NUDIX hydrolase [Tepidanaerobacter acetatoxydans]
MNFNEITLNSKNIFSGRILKLRLDEVLLPNGRKSTREIVEHPGAVAIVALDEENNILMVRQYRKPIEKELLEIPAGKLEKDESKEICARRELMEETGYYPNEIQHIISFYTSPGFSNEIIHLFLAKNLEKKDAEADFDEYLQLEIMPFKDAIKKIYSGQIVDGKTITGLLLTYSFIMGDV